MNLWILAAVVIGFLVIGGIALAVTTTAENTVTGGCKSCNGKCDAENNCGLESCQALNSGSCGCKV